MWFTLVLAVFACLLILYVPGFLLGRALNFGRFASAACAPMFSMALFAVLGIVLQAVGVSCPAWVLLVIGIVISAVAFGICFAVRRRNDVLPDIIMLEGEALPRPYAGAEDSPRPVGDAPKLWKAAAIYIAIALIVVIAIFVTAPPSADAFARTYDTSYHLALPRSFINSGTYSALHASAYLEVYPGAWFYPASWHVIVAMVASLFGNAVTLATNAACIAFLAFVFPLAFCLLVSRLFSNVRGTLYAGSLFSVAFCGFPWGLMASAEQMLPNMVAFMFVPIVLVLLIELIETDSFRTRILVGIGVLAGLVVMLLSQPNAAFTLGIWAVLWGISKVLWDSGEKKFSFERPRILRAVIILVTACALWAAMYFMPFMQDVIAIDWSSRGSALDALLMGSLFMFHESTSLQPIITIFVVAGIIYAIRNRRYLWLVIAFALGFALYVMGYVADLPFKAFFTGFWYNDAIRLAAMAALFAMPLAVLGFAWITTGIRSLLAGNAKTGEPSLAAVCVPSIVLALILACGLFVPFQLPVGGRACHFGLMGVRANIEKLYSWDSIYTAEERAFVQQAAQLVEPGAIVYNISHDGSGWSYGVDNFPAYLRRANMSGNSFEQARFLRLRLPEAASSLDVQETLEEAGVRYLLILDDASGANRTLFDARYDSNEWDEIEAINEDTPGFTLILSEGDMRLYRIEYEPATGSPGAPGFEGEDYYDDSDSGEDFDSSEDYLDDEDYDSSIDDELEDWDSI